MKQIAVSIRIMDNYIQSSKFMLTMDLSLLQIQTILKAFSYIWRAHLKLLAAKWIILLVSRLKDVLLPIQFSCIKKGTSLMFLSNLVFKMLMKSRHRLRHISNSGRITTPKILKSTSLFVKKLVSLCIQRLSPVPILATQ